MNATAKPALFTEINYCTRHRICSVCSVCKADVIWRLIDLMQDEEHDPTASGPRHTQERNVTCNNKNALWGV